MKNLVLANRLKSARIKSGISVQSISKDLTEIGFKASPNTIYSWENGNSQPTPDAFLFLCDKYGVENILSEFGYSTDKTNIEIEIKQAEQDDFVSLLKFSETLNEKGKRKLLDYAEDLNKIEEYRA